MPQPSNWGSRPSKKRALAPDALDKFVSGKGETARLNVEIPGDLRARVKAACALEGRDIKDVVVELLEKRFPRK